MCTSPGTVAVTGAASKALCRSGTGPSIARTVQAAPPSVVSGTARREPFKEVEGSAEFTGGSLFRRGGLLLDRFSKTT
ncbi:hypothetical protein GCM10009744_25680 [Kribbella alba]|uniref:Uncharacterized protein n=1 Tax=Kribbella alba TaxID=190197 RepID=A0ABP4R471_9ACTN